MSASSAPSNLTISATPLSADAEVLSAAPPRGFWALTWLQFRKRKDAYIAFWMLGLLFMTALSAPLLASNLPWLVTGPNGSASPLLRDFLAPLSHLDRFYNCVLIVIMVVVPSSFIARFAMHADPARVSKTARLCAISLFALLFTFSVFLGGKNVRVNYKAAEAGRSAIFTLIPFGPLEDESARSDLPPSDGHPLGSDSNGFDVLVRILHGARISLAVGFLATGLAVMIGITVGSLSGYFGGWVDLFISRVIEVFICFPSLFLILTIIAIVPHRSIFWVMFAIGLTGWTGIARLIRGEVLKVRQLDYIHAARALGAANLRIVFRHILPNALAPVLVAATFGVAGAILTESALGFLGLGVEPPTPSWGELLNQARQDPARLWWLMAYPGFMIFLSVTLMNLVGEGLRDAMDPKLRR